MKYFLIYILAVGILSFQSPQLDSKMPKNTIDDIRLLYIRYLYQKYPTINLPFHYQTQLSLSVTEFWTDNNLDTLVFGNSGLLGIIGTIPDTTNYFGFFYLLPADDIIPGLITFNKAGTLISNNLLASSCWQGCESDCRSVINIDNQLNIEFKYEEFNFDFDFDKNFCGKHPISAEGFIQLSHIDVKGNLVQDSLDSLSINELMKNPIIHAGD